MEIMKTIADPVSQLALWLEETYQVDIAETIAKWHELTGMNITVKEGEVSYDKVQSLDVDSTKSPKSKKIPRTKDVCQHIFLSGNKAGEQCTTKPKGGATHCSAHRSKDSVKSATKGTKAPKKREVKKVDKIDPVFDYDTEIDDKPVKVQEKPKKSKKEDKVQEQPKRPMKKVCGDTDMSEDSDGDLIPREYKLEKLAAKAAAEAQKKKLEDSEPEALSEPETPVKPLLKKKATKGTTKPSKKVPKQYDTDEEKLDHDLDLSDDE